MRLHTDYVVGEIPHEDHPAPQAMRQNWQNLNGKWQLTVLDKGGTPRLDGEILVPFSPECLLSGFQEDFCLQRGEKLIYTRKFLANESLLLGCVKLHFGAVDYECEVLLNGKKAGEHSGGFTPFCLDVTNLIQAGENVLEVACFDEGTRNGGVRGKQLDKRGGIWYTPQSGIWQTVWLEGMPKEHIRTFLITPDFARRAVKIQVDCPTAVQIEIFDGDKSVFRSDFEREIFIEGNFQLWSPENPKLYDFVLTTKSGDKMRSYFGVRGFGKTVDEHGISRLTLNGKPYFFSGVLDQGYWSDGMLTPPSDKAMEDELALLKEMGFNTVRKHIKLEPMRWYYHCDKLGLVVWQDFVNAGGMYSFTHVAAFPFLGFHHKDSDYKYFAMESKYARNAYFQSAKETVENLYNCTSIGAWVIFNEGWGQFDSEQMTKTVRGWDDTRILDAVSGWHDQGEDKTELKSLHIYYTPLKVPKTKRPVVLSEFGGYSMKCDGHVFDENKEFGYKKFRSKQKLEQALEKLFIKKLLPLIKKGLCASIYTQVSDVEEEINGLVTYDRKIVKVSSEKMRSFNAALYAEQEKIR